MTVQDYVSVGSFFAALMVMFGGLVMWFSRMTNAPILQKMETICSRLDSTIARLEIIATAVQEHGERLAKVEAAAKSAHKRLDDLRDIHHGRED